MKYLFFLSFITIAALSCNNGRQGTDMNADSSSVMPDNTITQPEMNTDTSTMRDSIRTMDSNRTMPY